MKKIEKEFEQIRAFIASSRNRAAGFLNYVAVATYWTIGAYVSIRLASKDWGMKSVEQLCDYLKTREPMLRGFGQRQIYNMMEFFKAYSSAEFAEMFVRLKLDEFVQSLTAKLPEGSDLHLSNAKSFPAAVLHLPNAKSDEIWSQIPECPAFLSLVNFTNHVIIINRCRRLDEKVFYILYGARERLKNEEMKRCIINDTYTSVMSKEKLVTKALGVTYPASEFLLKDRALLDFLGLPQKHTEYQLHAGIRENMKKFILELGKDFLWMGDEYSIQVNGKPRRLDLLFYHRALRCLIDVELKAVPFEPEFVGKMNFYLSAIDHEIKRVDENPSVGILLCPSAEKCDVRYALDCSMSPMMVAEYRRALIPEEVMKKSLEEYCAFMKKEEGGLK
ncbi:MAG: DUF1016 family protein [Kiritimatiellae bacterium]|nr:DUF1016 family protein [Kiritimatiellia bacterium]